MDNSDVTLYAKWLTLADLSNSETAINILKGWVSSDAGVYEFNESENSVVVTANTNKGKWSLFKHDISNVDGKFANALHFEVQGKEGQSILIKYNNKYEKKFILTGERQDLWMYLANELDTSINLMIFYGPNQTLTEAEQITFYKFEVLEPIDKLEHINILKGWFSNEEGKFEVVEESNSTSMTATTNKIGWEFVKIDLTQIENIDGNNLKSIVFEVQGEADHTFILKYNNRKEQKYVLDGTKQSFELEFAEPIDLSISNHLIIFIDGGKKIEEPVSITFTKLELISEYHEPVNIVYEDKQVDILKGWFDADGKGGYVVEENEDSVVVTATSLKGTWSTLKLFIDENVNNASKITIVAQGPVDQAILFKYNNSKEQKFIFDGTVQTFEMDITNLDVSKPLYFFFAPGQLIDDGNEMVVTFTKIEMIVKVAVSE